MSVTENVSTGTESSAGTHRGSIARDLVAVMFRPRATMRAILDEEPGRLVKTILALSILSAILQDFDVKGLYEATEMFGPAVLAGIVAVALIAFSALMVAFYLVISGAILLVGRWMEGTGSFKEVRTAVAWGLVPFVWSLAYLIPAVALSFSTGGSIETAGTPTLVLSDSEMQWSGGALGSQPLYLFVLLLVLDAVFMIWYFVVTSHTIAAAHRFSAWRGLGTLLLSLVLPFFTIAILAFVVWVYFQRLG
ncbi:MAG: YIP1 family protein [Thermoanaerobaculia bacterium]|nr:YIP1 family protein [Thermoanaerobaculia bacterium]